MRATLLFVLFSASAAWAANGACCIGTQCIAADIDAAECTQVYTGAFAGEGSVCSTCSEPVPCCSSADNTCTDDKPPAQCQGTVVFGCAGGTPNACLHEAVAPPPPPMGACCSATEAGCVLTSEAQCSGMPDATFLGVDTACAANSCQSACCLNAKCYDGMLRQHCVSANGKYLGLASTCAAQNTSACGGACCAPDGSTCAHAESLSQCTDDMHGLYAGDGKQCEDEPCKGGCCSSEAQCTDHVTKTQCGTDATFVGVGRTCTDYTCGGACCNDAEDTCMLQSSDTQCLMSGGRWVGYGVGCDGNAACVQQGACCLPAATEAEPHAAMCMLSDGATHCESLGGTWKGEGAPCGSNEYTPDSVCYVPTAQPTVAPTKQPTRAPTTQPTKAPTMQPTNAPSPSPTAQPTPQPTTQVPTPRPTVLTTTQLQAQLRANNYILQSQTNHSVPLAGEGACCHPADLCVHVNPIDCAAGGGYFRGENSTCDDLDVCARCLPCIMEEDETGYCPVRLYDSFASDAHHTHAHAHANSHTHHVHHRDEMCEEPQICTTNYGRCFFPSSQKADDPASSVRYCGGEETADLACTAELGNGRCAIGRCKPDAVLGAYGQYSCVDLREFPCGCVCFDDSALSCGAAKGVLFNDKNRDGIHNAPGEEVIAGATMGIWLDDSLFTLPVTTPPIAVRVSDERGEYVFNSLAEARYHIVIIALPPPYVILSTTPDVRTVDITCPGLLHADTSDSDNDDDDHHPHSAYHYATVQRKLVKAGGTLSAVESAAHLDMDNDFGVGAAFTVSGRVVVDENEDNIAQSTEEGVGHATIHALMLPTRHRQATAISSAVDGSFVFEGLPEGTYDFEEEDPPHYKSTGDSVPPNDNIVPNILVSYASGNITSGIDFFDASDDDDDGDLTYCHNILTWWLYGECHAHVWEEHITTALLTLLVFFGFCICLVFCVAGLVFSGAFFRRRAPRSTESTSTPPPDENESTQLTRDSNSRLPSTLSMRQKPKTKKNAAETLVDDMFN